MGRHGSLAGLLLACTGVLGIGAAAALTQTPGDRPALPGHVSQTDIDRNRWTLSRLADVGRIFFSAKANRLDGFGRPASTGNGAPTKRAPDTAPFVLRTSGPDANSCAGCHNDPVIGSSGDFVANVFVLAQVRDPVTESVSTDFSNERNTLGMDGSGAIEMLAREMTEDLHAIREAARAQAASSNQPIRKLLSTKGVSFGAITANPNGTYGTAEVEGVDTDLIVKPFHQKGVVNSLRVFTVNAFNHHHGLQAVERFGTARTGEADFDEDGVPNELTEGDITAATIFQAAMPSPGQVLPSTPSERSLARLGERLFAEIGCGDCHRPALPLRSSIFTEPNPYNPPGNLRPSDVTRPFSFDLARLPGGRGVERSGRGAIVRAFTDLKRHVISDEADPFFANEKLIQGGVPTNQFITRKLWDCGSSGPWGHRGDCSTIGEAILHHAGEARPHRNRYADLGASGQRAIVAFLETLRVVPPPPPND